MAWLQETLDYDALRLQPFYAGALVRFQGQFHTVADPLRWVSSWPGGRPLPFCVVLCCAVTPGWCGVG